jgi:hypothetical protein
MYGQEITIKSFTTFHSPKNWEYNMLLNWAYPYQPCALCGKHGSTFHEPVLNWFEQELTANPICTLGTFPNHLHSHSIHDVPFQTIHVPIPYIGYHTKPSLAQILTSYDGNNHQPNRTLGTFPNRPQSHSVYEVPFQAIHISIPHIGYWPQPKPYSGHLSKPSTFPFRTRGTFPSYLHSQSVCWVPTTT